MSLSGRTIVKRTVKDLPVYPNEASNAAYEMLKDILDGLCDDEYTVPYTLSVSVEFMCFDTGTG